MTIKAVAAAGLLSFGVLLSAVPSMAAAPAGTDDYENGIAAVRQELTDNYLLGVRRRERV